MDHTFAIPVYGVAQNLVALVESLRRQSLTGSEILVATSTPSTQLELLAARHSLPLYVNPQRIDIAADWNFALGLARTQFVTLAHQDDLYAPGYIAGVLDSMRRHPDALLAFCDYTEHTLQGTRRTNINLRIKRALRRRAFGARECLTTLAEKTRLLSLGNPICCPSVTLNRTILPEFRFPSGLQTNLDWMAWLELARQPGSFVYVQKRLVSKGIHPNSATTSTIANRAREREDRLVFDAIWPRPVAAALATLYKLSYRANRS